MARADEWLALAQTLLTYDPDTLAALGFFEHGFALREWAPGAIQRPQLALTCVGKSRWAVACGTLITYPLLMTGEVS